MDSLKTNDKVENSFRQAQTEIDGLPAELKVIADKYLKFGGSPTVALAQARARQEIQGLFPEIKITADKYLEYGQTPFDALRQARVLQQINGLPPGENKETALGYINDGRTPIEARSKIFGLSDHGDNAEEISTLEENLFAADQDKNNQI